MNDLEGNLRSLEMAHYFLLVIQQRLYMHRSTVVKHYHFYRYIETSKSQPSDDKPPLKGAWSHRVTHFNFLVPLKYLWNG